MELLAAPMERRALEARLELQGAWGLVAKAVRETWPVLAEVQDRGERLAHLLGDTGRVARPVRLLPAHLLAPRALTATGAPARAE